MGLPQPGVWQAQWRVERLPAIASLAGSGCG